MVEQRYNEEQYMIDNSYMCPECKRKYEDSINKYCPECGHGLNKELEPLKEMLNANHNLDAINWLKENYRILHIDKKQVKKNAQYQKDQKHKEWIAGIYNKSSLTYSLVAVFSAIIGIYTAFFCREVYTEFLRLNFFWALITYLFYFAAFAFAAYIVCLAVRIVRKCIFDSYVRKDASGFPLPFLLYAITMPITVLAPFLIKFFD